jgi:broad specificity phosphatase PhoE
VVRIYFATHSTTCDNERGIASGHHDAQLSPAGRVQATALADSLRHLQFDLVFCSPLSRARETATIAFGGRYPIQIDARLGEVDYGTYNGAPSGLVDQIRQMHVTIPFPAGESYEQRLAQMQAFLDDFAREHTGRTPLLIGHRATLYCLQVLSNRKTFEAVMSEPFEWRPYWEFQILVPH